LWLVLIEPLWNWKRNKLLQVIIFQVSFNRTIVELKQFLPDFEYFWQKVLIEPLWNWNWSSGLCPKLQSRVLIEPLWNWNYKVGYFLNNFVLVLIEPLWNWNRYFFNLLPNLGWVLIEPLWNWNNSWPVGRILYTEF